MPSDRFTRPDPSLQISFFPAPEVRRIHIPDAPEYMHGISAVFISDVHLRRCVSQKKLDDLIHLIGSLRADMLLLGGDYGEGHDQCERFFKALSPLHFALGSYAVPGNNDCYEDLEAMVRSGNGQLLCNKDTQININGGVLRIGGSDEHKYGHPDTRHLFRDQSSYRILISHFPVEPECTCDLQLSGHTHGGQMNVFGITPYTVWFEHRYAMTGIRGFLRHNNRYLLIGSGIGVSRLPLRVGTKSEIYLLQF